MIDAMVDYDYDEDNEYPMYEDPELAGCKGCVDCGPIVDRVDGSHAHENIDGRCWHEDGE